MKIGQIILFVSLLASVGMMVAREGVLLGLCDSVDFSCRSAFDLAERILLFGPFILFFSILTNLMPPKVFVEWWKFAKYSIPTILLLSVAINLELHHSPAGQWQGMFDAPALVLLYLIFTVGSVVQIIRGYRQ